jgi:L-cystine uptake protein TcyP (sodium:dicarboxylate symporter family)
MAEPLQQSYANHGRIDPSFHFFLVPVATISLIAAVVNVARFPGFGSAWLVVVSVAAIVGIFKMRLYSLKVQDRVIRLEERLRLQQILPEPLRSRVPELTLGQLVALRFAPDAELSSLVTRALNEKLSKDDLKKAVTVWRADFFRV